jgi:hypothetical protein
MGLSLQALYKDDSGKIKSYPLGKLVLAPWVLCSVDNGNTSMPSLEERGIHQNFLKCEWVNDMNYFGFNWCTGEELKKVADDIGIDKELLSMIKDNDIIQFCCDN